jgi:hypothetical protein
MESTYPPDRLMDFDPNLLRLAEAKLAQQPLQDPKGNYIVPWLAPEALRRGTLVNVEAKLVVHHFNVENDPSSVRSNPTFRFSSYITLSSRPTKLSPPESRYWPNPQSPSNQTRPAQSNPLSPPLNPPHLKLSSVACSMNSAKPSKTPTTPLISKC